MSFQPLAGISWGVSARRPRSSVATARGSVWWPADGPSPAAAPSPCEPSDPPAPVARPSLVLAPPAVLRPTITAVASMPAHTVDLAIRRVNPGRFLGLLATFAIEALPARPVRVHDYPPTTNRTSGLVGVLVVQVAGTVLETDGSGAAPAGRYQQSPRSGYSVRAKRATARPSRTRQVAATIATWSGTGTCQPPQVMPGSKVAWAAGLRSRWSNTVERIGSTA